MTMNPNCLYRIQLYRLEDYEKCYQRYVDLIKNSGDDYEDERYVNLAAVLVGLCAKKTNFKSDMVDENENTYEIVYNKACVLISKGKYADAIKKLNEAESEYIILFCNSLTRDC